MRGVPAAWCGWAPAWPSLAGPGRPPAGPASASAGVVGGRGAPAASPSPSNRRLRAASAAFLLAERGVGKTGEVPAEGEAGPPAGRPVGVAGGGSADCGGGLEVYDHAPEKKWSYPDIMGYHTEIENKLPMIRCKKCGHTPVNFPSKLLWEDKGKLLPDTTPPHAALSWPQPTTIPTGLRLKAPGCEARATLGISQIKIFNSNGVASVIAFTS